MKKPICLGLAVAAMVCSIGAAAAVKPTASEMRTAHKWISTNLSGKAAKAPFSFVYDAKPSSKLLKTWKLRKSERKLSRGRTQLTLAFTDPSTGLMCRCVAVDYSDFPTVEWTVYLKNTGKTDTPILEDIQAIDLNVKRGPEGEFVLHHNVGSPCQPNDFEPLDTPLGPNAEKRISAYGGRPTNSDLSYFNLQWPGKGMILAIGWPGQWAAKFARDDKAGLRIVAGQELTHLKLHPGEEIRTPLAIVQFHEGDTTRSQNIWRRWMTAHNYPRPGGKPIATHFASCYGSVPVNAKDETGVINGWLREGIKLDYWFIDTGWFPMEKEWYTAVGTWEVDKARFPKGLREVADLVHSNGMGFVVWFEPERVTPGTWLWENHPEWLLKSPDDTANTPQLAKTPNRLLDLGNPEALKWVIDTIDKFMDDQGIDVYRQDFNIDPLAYWRANDPPDRQGITENAYVCGYLAYWDELLRRNPKRWIDTCASGGRRNDLETLRRSVPLLRSDYFGDPDSQQAQTMGLSPWMPYYGSGTGNADQYSMRSSFCPAYRIGWDMRKTDLDYNLLRRTVADFRAVEPYLLGDFYPLTPYSLKKDAWLAYQFDRPEMNGGVLQVFRRSECKGESVVLQLKGLDKKAFYAVKDFDTAQMRRVSGKELMTEGLTVEITRAPGAAVIGYTEVK